MPVNAFLVEHPAGLCLVDAGQSVAASVPGYLPRWHPFLRIARFELEAGDEVAAQLAGLGFRPEQVRWVVLTHLHTDHIGGLGPFASAEVIVSEVEWRRASGLRGAIRGYVPKQWPATVEPRLVQLAGPPLGPFRASLDLVGDGTLRLVPLPRHTPGQIGVLVGEDGAGALVGGDVAHDRAELDALEPELAAYLDEHGLALLLSHDDDAPALLDLRAGLAVSRS